MQGSKKKIISTLIRKISLITFTLMTIGIFSNISTVAFADTTNWAPVGFSGFSAGTANYTNITIDSNGTPYVVYKDNSNMATVMKYNGTNWIPVGFPSFSAGMVNYTDIAIGSDGTPYVVYSDGYNSNMVTVMKYNGVSWIPVGSQGFSIASATHTNIAIDSKGTPYVVYRENISNKATVMKYNGVSWIPVGFPGFSAGTATYTNIAIDSNGTPYVVYSDGGNSDKATVMEYNGVDWISVGSQGFSAGRANYTNIAIDSNRTPYVIYQDGGKVNKPTVMKYNGAGWTPVGSQGFSVNSAAYTNIAIDSNGTPYAVYSDVGSGKATVMKYESGSWMPVGFQYFSASSATYTNIAIDSKGTPYVVYSDGGNGNKATVMKLSTYGIDLSQTGTYNFNLQIEGYAQVPAKSITVTKTGDGDITNLGINLTSGDINSFNVGTLSTNSLNDGTISATFTIQPKDGLSLGTYTATVNVTADNNLSETFDVSFTVSSSTDIINVNSIGDIDVINGTDMDDIGLPTSINVTLANLTTTSAAVTWDNGTPEYDGNTAGTYEFKGTLILTNGVTNTNNKYATANVVLAADGGVTPPPTPPVNPSGPSIIKQPSSQTVRKGKTANFSIEVTGIEPFTYQWQKDGLDLTDSDDISGTNKSILKIKDVRKSDAGKYGCIVADGDFNVTTSSAAILKVTSKSSSSGSSSSSSSSSSNNKVSDTVTITSTNDAAADEMAMLNALNTKTTKTVTFNFDTLANTNKTPLISQSILAALKANPNKTLIIKTNNSSVKITSNTDGQVQFTEDDVKIIGFKTVVSGNYYLDVNGIMQTDWIKTGDGIWYHFNTNSGTKDFGWFQDIDGAKYYLDETTGIMKTGWFKDANNTWYYFDKTSGAMKTGWIKDNGKWYYLYSDGKLAVSTTIEGYNVNEKGEWV